MTDDAAPHGIERPTLPAEATQRPTAERYLRECHEHAVEHLAELRAQRDALNERIREEVENELLLGRAVAVFDRAREKDESTE